MLADGTVLDLSKASNRIRAKFGFDPYEAIY